MSTLQAVRDRIRNQLDLEVEDLDDPSIDLFIKEGFDRTFAAHHQWPFFEKLWTEVLVEGAETLSKPTDLGAVAVLRNAVDNVRLTHVAQRVAEDNFEGVLNAGEPALFSMWGQTIHLWPIPTSQERTYHIRGYRKAAWTGDANAELDGDDRLHPAVAHYACSLVAAQLEEPELEAQYLSRWQGVLGDIMRDVTRPETHEPMVLNGGLGGYIRWL